MKLIDKAAVVALIEKIINALKENCTPNPMGNMQECLIAAEIEALNLIKDSLYTIELKEVDLEKEIKDYLRKQPIAARSQGTDLRLVPSPEKIAKHFFELGLAQKG